ncbi:hypothetical protein NMY22_g15394 [Coprinellus aureogranulatus]|nr:hypothetical protein NMY22_g15394 [Coprinellus aureogranulatus]
MEEAEQFERNLEAPLIVRVIGDAPWRLSLWRERVKERNGRRLLWTHMTLYSRNKDDVLIAFLSEGGLPVYLGVGIQADIDPQDEQDEPPSGRRDRGQATQRRSASSRWMRTQIATQGKRAHRVRNWAHCGDEGGAEVRAEEEGANALRKVISQTKWWGECIHISIVPYLSASFASPDYCCYRCITLIPSIIAMSTFEPLVSDLARDAQRAQPRDALQYCANWRKTQARDLLAQRSDSISAPAELHTDTPLVAPKPPSLQPRPPFGTLNVPGNALLSGDRTPPSMRYNQAELPPTPPLTTVNPFASFDSTTPTTAYNNSGFSEGGFNDNGYLMVPTSSIFARRTSVFAESIAVDSGVDEVLPVYSKTPEQLRRIKVAVRNNFIFRGLDEEQIKGVLGAMQERKAVQNEVVIRQGDVGEYFYVVEEGQMNRYIQPEPLPPNYRLEECVPLFISDKDFSFDQTIGSQRKRATSTSSATSQTSTIPAETSTSIDPIPTQQQTTANDCIVTADRESSSSRGRRSRGPLALKGVWMSRGLPGYRLALERVFNEASQAIADGGKAIALTDWATAADRLPSSALITCGGVHHYLTSQKKRSNVAPRQLSNSLRWTHSLREQGRPNEEVALSPGMPDSGECRWRNGSEVHINDPAGIANLQGAVWQKSRTASGAYARNASQQMQGIHFGGLLDFHYKNTILIPIPMKRVEDRNETRECLAHRLLLALVIQFPLS